MTTAERYLGLLRAQRKLTPIIGLTSGIKLERDQFAGVDFRSVLDAGLSWALVRRPIWTLDGVTGLAWNHESRTVARPIDHPVGVLQLLSRIPFGTAGDTTQRFTYYPDFSESAAYRSEGEITAQAALNAHLALKFGYLIRFSNDPVPGFKKTDNTTTASVVVRWKAVDARAGAIGKICNAARSGQRRFCVANGVRRQRIASFRTISRARPRASSSHWDDAMMRRVRMTIAALGKRIDARFKRADGRTRARFDSVDARFDTVDARFDAVDARFNAVDARFDAVDARFNAVDARFDAIDARFDRMDAAIERRFAQADRKVESLGEKLDRIAGILDDKFVHQQKALDEHQKRITDIEHAARG